MEAMDSKFEAAMARIEAAMASNSRDSAEREARMEAAAANNSKDAAQREARIEAAVASNSKDVAQRETWLIIRLGAMMVAGLTIGLTIIGLLNFVLIRSVEGQRALLPPVYIVPPAAQVPAVPLVPPQPAPAEQNTTK